MQTGYATPNYLFNCDLESLCEYRAKSSRHNFCTYAQSQRIPPSVLRHKYQCYRTTDIQPFLSSFLSPVSYSTNFATSYQCGVRTESLSKLNRSNSATVSLR